MLENAHRFNYVDKKDKLLPWVDEQLNKYSPRGKCLNLEYVQVVVVLTELKKKLNDGFFDWQPGSE